MACNSLKAKGHDQLVVKHTGIDQISDSSINHDAGIQNQRLETFDFAHKFHVGNQKRKSSLVWINTLTHT